MKNAKNNLKVTSILILAFAALAVINVVCELLFGSLNDAAIPEGSPDNILLITKIFLAVLTFLITLPQLYVGLKGLKIVKNPDSSRAHIIWATILLVFSIIGLLSPVLALVRLEDILSNVSQIISIGAEVFIYIVYLGAAKAIAKGE